MQTIEHEYYNEIVASNDNVLTNYQEGDNNIIYSTKIIFNKDSEPEGFYEMSVEEAEEIEASLMKNFEFSEVEDPESLEDAFEFGEIL